MRTHQTTVLFRALPITSSYMRSRSTSATRSSPGCCLKLQTEYSDQLTIRSYMRAIKVTAGQPNFLFILSTAIQAGNFIRSNSLEHTDHMERPNIVMQIACLEQLIITVPPLYSVRNYN
uniref:Uncharacterized protein n=1 Tax=Ascaris lumbricoides TaxID=6252 RepID=A0A0M3HVU5_ASCLU